MCAARPGPLFFTPFPLLTRGGIINPTLKTACRDRARFRRDFRPLKIPTRLRFSIHTLFSLFFSLALPGPLSLSLSSLFIMSSFSSSPIFSRNLSANVKLTIYSVHEREIRPPSHLFFLECGVVPSVIQHFDAHV